MIPHLVREVARTPGATDVTFTLYARHWRCMRLGGSWGKVLASCFDPSLKALQQSEHVRGWAIEPTMEAIPLRLWWNDSCHYTYKGDSHPIADHCMAL